MAQDLLKDRRVQAFLATIRGPESGDRYNVRNGGTTFLDYSQHPGKQGHGSSAAGAYQITDGTWQIQAKELGLSDFSPTSQDLAAVNILRNKGAIDKLFSGDLDGAIYAAGTQWDTFPKSATGNHISKGSPINIQPLKDAYNENLH